MLLKLSTILECSRAYSLPMTVLSWLVIFSYATILNGHIVNGIIALIGLCFAHLGTNVLDDYFDYKFLIKQLNFNKSEYLKNTQKTKCRYILSGVLSEKEVLLIAAIYLFIAGIIGLFLYYTCGKGVLYFGCIGAIISVFYSFLSKIRLSEIAVGVAYGPALFGGVYYVMTKTFSWEILILSIPTMFITIILLYIHTIMDFEHDLNEGKNTLANMFDSQLDSLIVLKIFIIFAYSSILLLCIFDILDWQVVLVYLTIPLAIDLYESMVNYSLNLNSIPAKKWYHFPMENMKFIRQINAEPFMIRMYQSRNLMIYFALLLTCAIILSMI